MLASATELLLSYLSALVDYLNALGRQVSLFPLVAAIFFIYLAIKSDQDRRWFAVYAFTALGFLFAAVFIGSMPQIDIDYATAFLGFRQK